MNTRGVEAQLTKLRTTGKRKTATRAVEMSLRIGVRHYGPSGLVVVLPEGLPDAAADGARGPEFLARIKVPGYGSRPVRLTMAMGGLPAWFGESRPNEMPVRIKTPGYGAAGDSWGALSRR